MKSSSVELEHALVTFKPQQTITLFSDEKSSQTQPQLLCFVSKETSGELYFIFDMEVILLGNWYFESH